MRNAKIIGTFLVFFFVSSPLAFSVDKNKAKYVGGTVSTIEEGKEGKISLQDEKNLEFTYKSTTLLIPYDQINGLEYGQKAGRRVGVAILVSPIALLSKKRKHFLTISYLDEREMQQAVVFELGKNIVRVVLSSIEARTGQNIEYQDDEARKSSKGN